MDGGLIRTVVFRSFRVFNAHVPCHCSMSKLAGSCRKLDQTRTISFPHARDSRVLDSKLSAWQASRLAVSPGRRVQACAFVAARAGVAHQPLLKRTKASGPARMCVGVVLGPKNCDAAQKTSGAQFPAKIEHSASQGAASLVEPCVQVTQKGRQP